MGKRKKSVIEETSNIQSSEFYVNMEIEIHALRGKNKLLVQSVAKLQQDKAFLQKQITGLQEEHFKLNCKYCNLQNVFTNIENTTKLYFPKMVEVVNQMAKVMNLCSVGAAVSKANKDSQTLTVKPHMVNGTVINNPTITLSRFNDVELHRSPDCNAGTNANNFSVIDSQIINRSRSMLQDERPSTSRGFDEIGIDRRMANRDTVDFVTRIPRRIFNNEDLEDSPIDSSLESLDEQDEEEDMDEDRQRLVTIEEEPDDCNRTSSEFTDRQIRVIISPLPVQNTENVNNTSEIAFLGRSSSISGETSNSVNTNINDSSLTSVKSNTSSSDSDENYWINLKRASSNLNGSSFNHLEVNTEEHSNSYNTFERSKLLTMRSLGLSPKSHPVSTSTPEPPNLRSSSRISQKQKNSLSHQSNITKRKTGDEKLAQVIIKRLDLKKSHIPDQKVEEVLKTTPITSAKDIGRQNGSVESNELSEESSGSSLSKKHHESVKRKKFKKGKENRKQQLSLIQTTKSSPRPKRAARPAVLKESSLKKKMRRSK